MIKAEDGAQDRGSGGQGELVACVRQHLSSMGEPNGAKPVVLSVMSATPGSLRPSRGPQGQNWFCLFHFHFRTDVQ